MLIGVEYNKFKKSIIASYYDSAGKVAYISKGVKPDDEFVWVDCPETTPYKRWSYIIDGKHVMKQKSQYLNRFRLEELLISGLNKTEKEVLYGDGKPKITILDIETKVNEKDDFPYPDKAQFEVNLISMIHDNNVILMSTMMDATLEQQLKIRNDVIEFFRERGREVDYNLKYYYFKDEKSLLIGFFHTVMPKLSMIIGWNVIDFDWQTLVNRAAKYGIDIVERMYSKRCTGKMKVPIHLGLLDYKEICEEFEPVKMAENYTLDYIANMILGIKKMKNPYNSFHEFQKHPMEFAIYNVIDSVLVDLIEKEKKLMSIVYQMSNIAKVEVNMVFNPVFKTEIFFCREFITRGMYMPEKDKDLGNGEKYIGAYVMEPTPGHYRYISCFDYSSQYPNLQMQMNISPDVYLGMLGQADLSKWSKNDIIVAKNTAVFIKGYDSAARVIQKRFYESRMEIKAENGTMSKLKKKIKKLEEEKASLISQLKN